MFKKVFESLEKANVRAKLKSGELACPNCGGPGGELPKNWEDLMVCGSCGDRASLTEWASGSGEGNRIGFADRPPAGTKIRRETIGADSVIWHIPAVGKFGFFMFFAVFWLLITGTVSGGFLLSFLTGGKIEGDGPGWLLVPFFGLFWAVGLGMLYAAFRQKFMRHAVTFDKYRVTLRKEMFGRSSEKSLDRSGIVSISQKEFYQQNYQSVYGIEIRGEDGKLRFGSSLTAEEKAWLVADFNQVLAGEKEPDAITSPHGGLAPMKVGVRKSVFSIEIPKPAKSAVIGSLIFSLIGIGFVCLGIFVIDGDPMPEDGSSGFSDWIEFIFSNGFRTVWTLFSSFCALLGLGMTFTTLRAMKQDCRIEGTEVDVSIRTYRNGLVYADKSFPRHEVHDIRAINSGSSNGNTMKRVEMLVGNKSVKIASWMDGDIADKLVREVRAALGR